VPVCLDLDHKALRHFPDSRHPVLRLKIGWFLDEVAVLTRRIPFVFRLSTTVVTKVTVNIDAQVLEVTSAVEFVIKCRFTISPGALSILLH
jgi:hypothetical protein